MAEQLANQVHNPVSYTEIPDAMLATRIDSAQNSLEYLSGERRRVVMHGLTRLLFEQEARSSNRHSADQWSETRLAVQGYDMMYGAGSEAEGVLAPPVLGASEGAVVTS